MQENLGFSKKVRMEERSVQLPPGQSDATVSSELSLLQISLEAIMCALVLPVTFSGQLLD